MFKRNRSFSHDVWAGKTSTFGHFECVPPKRISHFSHQARPRQLLLFHRKKGWKDLFYNICILGGWSFFCLYYLVLIHSRRLFHKFENGQEQFSVKSDKKSLTAKANQTGGATEALLWRVTTIRSKQNWLTPLDKILPQDVRAMSEQIWKSLKEHCCKFKHFSREQLARGDVWLWS